TTLVILLVCINLTTLATIWLTRPAKSMGFDLPDGPKQFIIEKLHFNEEQIQAFDTLRKEHFEEMQGLRKQIYESKEDLYNQIKSDRVDTTIMFASIANIGRFEEKAERITMEHFRKVRQLCNDEQKQQFDLVISDVIKRIMLPPHHGQQQMHTPGSKPMLP
ncbi:MAG: hypothetical protein WCO54_09025, partial [Bacteroidota bacterium]